MGILGRTFYSAQKEIEEKLRRLEENYRQIERREQQKSQDLTIPLDLWLKSGLEEGGVLIIQSNPNIRNMLFNRLRNRGYKVRAVVGGEQALAAFREASYSLVVVHWGIFQKSSELVSLLRKAFPQTRIIITSSNFAWVNENSARAQNGLEALEAGAYSYLPDQHIRRSILRCVETALKSKERACPVLLSGMACNLRCVI
jgi:DNA-binding NarL/FixJ family response regulator